MPPVGARRALFVASTSSGPAGTEALGDCGEVLRASDGDHDEDPQLGEGDPLVELGNGLSCDRDEDPRSAHHGVALVRVGAVLGMGVHPGRSAACLRRQNGIRVDARCPNTVEARRRV
jgi:hypothetical protein